MPVALAPGPIRRKSTPPRVLSAEALKAMANKPARIRTHNPFFPMESILNLQNILCKKA
jgi:hypothetical protein